MNTIFKDIFVNAHTNSSKDISFCISETCFFTRGGPFYCQPFSFFWTRNGYCIYRQIMATTITKYKDFRDSWEIENSGYLINHHLSMTSLGRTPLESRGSRCHGFGRTLIWVWQSRHQVFVFQQFCVVPLDLTSPPDRQENVNINASLKIVNFFWQTQTVYAPLQDHFFS